MAEDLITAECPRCGAGLDIYRDTASLTCHQCARDFRVSRRGQAIELDETVARVMEVRPWPESVSVDSAVSQIEQSLENRREERRAFNAWVQRRRLVFRMIEVPGSVLVLLAGGWIVRDKDSGTQVTMLILLGGTVVLYCFLRPLIRDGHMRDWSFVGSKWPWWWKPNDDEIAKMQSLKLEIDRLEGLLRQKQR